jgi:hypothetical protein
VKQNCWDVQNCDSRDNCPAFKEVKLNGVHGGVNGGRACWVIAFTQCNDRTQGNAVNKYATKCSSCNFYHMVREDEKESFQLLAALMYKLGE